MKTTTNAAIPMATNRNRKKNNTDKKQVLEEHALWNAGQQKRPGFFEETSMSCLHDGVYPRKKNKKVWLLCYFGFSYCPCF